MAPNAYGGQFVMENGEGAGGLIMSTGTVARFLATHAVWNIGPRELGARYGEFAGTGAAAVSRGDGRDFAYAFNHLIDSPAHDALVAQINAVLDRHSRVTRSVIVTSLFALLAKVTYVVRNMFGRHRDP